MDKTMKIILELGVEAEATLYTIGTKTDLIRRVRGIATQ